MTINISNINILSTITIIGVGGFFLYKLIEYWVGKFVDLKFGLKLENHKAELNKISEGIKFDFQRKLQDFSLFTTKRHAAYLEVYIAMIETRQAINDYYTTRQIENFSNFSKSEIKEILLRRHISEDDVNTIIEASDIKDQTEKNHKIYQMSRQLMETYALDKLTDSEKILNHLDLYLSEEVSQLAMEIRGEFFKILTYLYEHKSRYNSINNTIIFTDRDKEIFAFHKKETEAEEAYRLIRLPKWDQFRQRMQVELRVGDYQK